MARQAKHDHAAMVAAILRTYDRADDDAIRSGADWYPAMARRMAEHANATGYTVAQCAGVYAANSTNTPWARNLRLASAALADRGMTGGTLSSVVAKVNAILAGGDLAAILSPDPDRCKLANFARNLAGDPDAVTVDRWALRIAYNFADCATGGETGCAANGRHACGYVPLGGEYRAIADAYRSAAMLRAVTPATMQAVTWVVARGTGE